MSDLGGTTNGTTTTTNGTTTDDVQNLGTQNDLRPMVLGVTWSLTILSLLFLGARCYIKRTTRRSLYADDYILIAAAGTLIAFAGTTTWGCANQLGVSHNNAQYAAEAETVDKLQLIVVIANTFSVLGAAWSKTAFAITLLTVTKGLLRKFIWFIIGSMNFILAFNVLMQFIRCSPVEGQWMTGENAKCWPRPVLIYYSIVAAGYSAAMDIILTMIPWWVVMKLKMQTKEMVGVAVCMSLGLIAAMTSIFRAHYIPTVYDNDNDNAFDEASLFVWTAAELAVTIIAVSIPVLRLLVVTTARRDRGNRTHTSTGASYPNTFKSGTYMCSAVSRSQNYYHRMDENDGSCGTSASDKSSSKSKVIDYSANDASNLIPGQPDVVYFHDKEKGGGIMKTEEVTVDYDRASRGEGLKENFERRAILGFELEDMSSPPTVDRSKRQR